MDFGWLSLTDSSVENIHSRHQEESVNTTTKKLQKPTFPIWQNDIFAQNENLTLEAVFCWWQRDENFAIKITDWQSIEYNFVKIVQKNMPDAIFQDFWVFL